MKQCISVALIAFTLMSCSTPHAGPDKTIAGAVLGAGWGAGAGAVVGNQIDNVGAGAGVGAGFGLIGGAIAGASHDSIDSIQSRQDEELASLRIQNLATSKELAMLQGALDRAVDTGALGGVYQVFFDAEETNLRAGAVANLEVIADTIKASAASARVSVVGHTDDAGNPEHNQKLAEARARTVSAYLAARGISMDQIEVKSFGSERPIASNTTPVGRQLNRRVDIYLTR